MNTYLPKKGELVRVLEVATFDATPCVKAGDIVETTFESPEYEQGFCYLYTAGGITYARVEPAEAAPYVPAFDASSVRPDNVSDAVVAACEAAAASVPAPRMPQDMPAALPPWLRPGTCGCDEPLQTTAATPQGKGVNPKEQAATGEGRIPWQALPVRPLVGAALAMGEGAHKYGRHNYRRTVIKSSVYFDSTLRHFFAWWEGEDIDPDSGLHHIDKAIAGLLVLRDAQLRGMSDDDRPPSCDPWVKQAGAAFGDMRARLQAQHGAAKPPARADGADLK